ncbi:MAG: hypothetical protein KA204_07505 [Chromatiaceae bacterium]|nr:hypothetical protein [Chromatiaceae bacterium]MBP6733499.1 hypothetical protein [Chromatiaceae bacterium]MBP6806925.1 hypothetical protein [Chromatiaceae bacterium]MBP8288425.1 hypothetical protein [Chromatiaceae bacterium]MBP9602747.1 hypothetical protein [Chromatiaceae bacterium]
MKKYIQYADFKNLLRVPDGEEDGVWTPWLSVREGGVYFNLPEENVMLTTAELMAAFDFLEEVDFSCVKKNPKVLGFPCDLNQLECFVEEYGLSGAINAFDLLDWVMGDEPAYERLNDLSIELDVILSQMRREGMRITSAPVWRRLLMRAGKRDSCIKTGDTGVIWWEDNEVPKPLSQGALKQRIRRWNLMQKRS